MTRLRAAFVSIEAASVGAIAQLVERVVRNDEVGGSNPPGSTLRLRLRVAQPRKSRRRSVSGVACRAKTDEDFHIQSLILAFGYAWRSHARAESEACPA